MDRANLKNTTEEISHYVKFRNFAGSNPSGKPRKPHSDGRKHEKMGGSGTPLPHLHQTGKTPCGEHRRIVHERPAPLRPLHPAPMGRRTAQGGTRNDRTLSGPALRTRKPQDVAGPQPERHPELLQLPAAGRKNRDLAGGIHHDAQIRPPTAGRTDDRRNRPHHSGHRPDDPQGPPRRRDAGSALLVRTSFSAKATSV